MRSRRTIPAPRSALLAMVAVVLFAVAVVQSTTQAGGTVEATAGPAPFQGFVSGADGAPAAAAVARRGSRVTASTDPGAFVRRVGDHFELAGAPWTFTGVNVYNASSRANCWYTMHAPDLATVFTTTGATVMRTWMFQSLALVPTAPSVLDFSAFDETLAAARAAGVRVVATLSDEWGACDPGGVKTIDWYRTGYRSDRPADLYTHQPLPLTYRDYVTAIVQHYRDDPTILGWQLVNEPEAHAPDGSCPSDAGAVLRSFVADVAGQIRAVDPDHLLSIGTIGSGQCGTLTADYRGLVQDGGLDWCEVHDYYGPVAFGGDQWNGMAARMADCAAVGRPMVVGESGVPGDLPGGAEARRQAFADKLAEADRRGISGYLVWGWSAAASGDGGADRFALGPDDPTWALLAARRHPPN